MRNGGCIDEWYHNAMVYLPNVGRRMIGCSMQDGDNAVKKRAGMDDYVGWTSTYVVLRRVEHV